VLIGPQGSGKSTLAKLVASCLDIADEFVENYFNNNNKRNPTGGQNILEGYGLQTFVSSSTSIKFRNKEIAMLNDQLSFVDKDIENTLRLVNDSYQTEVNVDQRSKDFDRLVALSKYMPQPRYIPSERVFFATFSGIIFNLLFNKIPLPPLLVELGVNIEGARSEIKELQTVIEGIQYKNLEGIDHVIADGKLSKLSESASGFQSLIPLQLLVDAFSKSNRSQFLIEEPELNLYPPTQKKLIYHLVEKCTKSNNQLLLTTHSPYVLSSLNNLLFAYKVAQKHPEQADEIANIIPRESWLNPEEFAAYFVADGTVRSIVNPKTGLISENELDGVSENIGDEFDALMEIYSEKANEGSY
jgi:predicted ATPase